jgi:hypothetical protein
MGPRTEPWYRMELDWVYRMEAHPAGASQEPGVLAR